MSILLRSVRVADTLYLVWRYFACTGGIPGELENGGGRGGCSTKARVLSRMLTKMKCVVTDFRPRELQRKRKLRH